jgi:hypothetical protein
VLPLSKWQLMKQKDVSSKLNLMMAAPLLAILPLKPNFTFDVAMSESL